MKKHIHLSKNSVEELGCSTIISHDYSRVGMDRVRAALPRCSKITQLRCKMTLEPRFLQAEEEGGGTRLGVRRNNNQSSERKAKWHF